MASQARFLSRILMEDTTPEDVDNTEAGWSTDFAITVLGVCFIYTSCTSYNRSTRNFMYMHLGTAIAHLFGGFAHAIYPNRASDGVGMVGFYVTIGIGYFGNCMRYGLGWGLPRCWAIIALLNVIWLTVAGIFAILKMERTNERIDDAGPPDELFIPDTAFGYGELFCALMEILASIYYVVKVDRSFFAFAASFSNLVGWISVYAVGLWAATTATEYNTRITQLIFHYAMLVFLWAINELALVQTKETATDKPQSKKQADPSSSSEVEEGAARVY